MALIVVFQNVTGDTDLANYAVEVYVNRLRIAHGLRVAGHHRADGWEQLVRQFAAGLPAAREAQGTDRTPTHADGETKNVQPGHAQELEG